MPEAGNRLSRWVNGVVLLLVGRAAPGSSKTTHTSADEAALGWLGRATAVSGSALLRHTASRRARQRRSITAVPAGTSTPPLTSNNEAGLGQGGRMWSQSCWDCPPRWSQFGRSPATRRQAAIPSQGR